MQVVFRKDTINWLPYHFLAESSRKQKVRCTLREHQPLISDEKRALRLTGPGVVKFNLGYYSLLVASITKRKSFLVYVFCAWSLKQSTSATLHPLISIPLWNLMCSTAYMSRFLLTTTYVNIMWNPSLVYITASYTLFYHLNVYWSLLCLTMLEHCTYCVIHVWHIARYCIHYNNRDSY